jgi:hypothetical protein
MSKLSASALAVLAWAGVWAFWLAATHTFHPTGTLAVIVTTALVVAYAVTAFLNHLVLIPRLWSAGRWGWYAVWLLVAMATLTAAALVVIRLAYFNLLGPDPDPYGAYRHFAIDLVGMAVHLLAAAGVVAAVRWWLGRRAYGG